MTAKRQVSYQWRLRNVMAEHGMFTTTGLVPQLADRGITLSASQVHRLVTGTPERLSLPVLAALCDILEVTPAELIVTRAQNAAPRKAAAGGGPAPAGTGGAPPPRAPPRAGPGGPPSPPPRRISAGMFATAPPSAGRPGPAPTCPTRP